MIQRMINNNLLSFCKVVQILFSSSDILSYYFIVALPWLCVVSSKQDKPEVTIPIFLMYVVPGTSCSDWLVCSQRLALFLSITESGNYICNILVYKMAINQWGRSEPLITFLSFTVQHPRGTL
jgi:hypothetical protein